VPFDNKTFEEVIAYIAGFFDGEGSFCFRKARRIRPTPVVCAVQKDPEVLIAIKAFFHKTLAIDICLSQTAENKCWHLETCSKSKCLLICSILYPYLIVKKNQAAGVIEFINLRLDEGRMGRDNIDRENEIIATVGLLNGGRF